MEKTLHLIFSWKMAKAIFDLFAKYIPIYLYVLLTHKKEQLWLICERPTDARDNGYVLFKWIRENHPEKKILYAIKRKSKDYNNVKNLSIRRIAKVHNFTWGILCNLLGISGQ